MSQFNFPRINFTGPFTINVGTGNNDDYSSENFVNTPPFNGNPFRVSDSVNVQPMMYGMSETDFNNWVITPQQATQGTSTVLQIPGEWNYFGDMTITFNNVNVVGVTLGYDNTITDPSQNALIGANVSFTNDSGRSTAFICDINPEDVPSSQIFADTFAIRLNNQNLLEGKPSKGVTRWINFGRNVGLMNTRSSAMASAIFQSVIPVSDFSNPGMQTMLKALNLDPNNLPPNLGGFVVRYCFYRVIPQQANALLYPDPDDYANALAKMYQQGYPDYLNPGGGTVSGTVGLWFTNEMKTITMGRYLVKGGGISTQYPTVTLAPVVAQVNTTTQVISLDLSNAFPENYVDANNNPKLDIGTVFLAVLSNGTTYTIGNIAYDSTTYLTQGGMVDISYAILPPAVQSAIQTGQLLICNTQNGTVVTLLQESPYMVASDQALIYAEEGDDSGLYRNDGANPVPCMIQIYQQGVPVATETMTITEYSVTPNINQPIIATGSGGVSSNQPLTFDTSTRGSKLFLFQPGTVTPPAYGNLDLTSSFYINLRVLPKDDFSEYLGTGIPIPFSYLYANVLQYYNLIFPAMGLHVPFDEAVWQSLAATIYQRVDVENWANTSYMPRPRDLSATRRALIQAWCKQYMQ